MWIFLCLFTKKLNKYNHLCVSARVVTCWRTHRVVSSTLLLVCPCVIASAGVPVAWGGYGVPAHPRPVPANQVLMCGGNRRRAAWQMAGWPGKPAPFSGFSSRQMTGIYFITLKTGEGHAHTHKHTQTQSPGHISFLVHINGAEQTVFWLQVEVCIEPLHSNPVAVNRSRNSSYLLFSCFFISSNTPKLTSDPHYAANQPCRPISFSPFVSLTHIHIHIHIYTHIHTHTHARRHTRTHADADTHTHGLKTMLAVLFIQLCMTVFPWSSSRQIPQTCQSNYPDIYTQAATHTHTHCVKPHMKNLTEVQLFFILINIYRYRWYQHLRDILSFNKPL